MGDQVTATTTLDKELGPGDRARWELAAMAGRLRTLETRLAESELRAERLRRERDRLRDGEPRRFANSFRSFFRPGRPEEAAVPAEAPPPVTGELPAHLYVAVGLAAGAVQSFVQTVRQRVLVTPDHRPVVLTDSPDFAQLHDHGALLEYLPDRATWDRHRPDRPWDDVLAERLARLGRDHRAVRTVVVDSAKPPTLADLLR